MIRFFRPTAKAASRWRCRILAPHLCTAPFRPHVVFYGVVSLPRWVLPAKMARYNECDKS